MWGQDYPHAEGTYPYTREALRNTFAGVPTDEVAPMVGGTAAEVYGFDLDALAPVAERGRPDHRADATSRSTRSRPTRCRWPSRIRSSSLVSDRYLVISSDTHAGLPDEHYREYLDPQYRERFDDDIAQRHALRASMNAARGPERREPVRRQWYEENEEGLEGGWDAAHRDKELDADGVAGEVIFPDADAVRGGASAPFGAGLGFGGEFDAELLMAGARAHNRWLAELCSDSPDRRCGLAIAPILHDIDDARRGDPARARIGAARPADPRVVASVPRLQRRAVQPGLGGVRGAARCRCTRTPVPRPARTSADDIGIYHDRDDLVDGTTAVVPALVGSVRALSRG